MRISDWSSDVCSSDLAAGEGPGESGLVGKGGGDLDGGVPGREVGDVLVAQVLGDDRHDLVLALAGAEGLELGIEVDLALAGDVRCDGDLGDAVDRSEEHTSELQSLMRISYAVFCLKKKTNKH